MNTNEQAFNFLYVTVERRDLVKVLYAAKRYMERHPKELNSRDRSWLNASIERCEMYLRGYQDVDSRRAGEAPRETIEQDGR